MTSTTPVLDRFDHETAWRLGSELVRRGQAEQLSMTIVVWLGDQRVFHAALPGTSADNDRWAERKANVVRHFAQASAEVYATYAGADVESFLRLFALPIDQYFPAGGAVPILVRGALVGVLAVSGLASDQDHEVAVAGLLSLPEVSGRDTPGR